MVFLIVMVSFWMQSFQGSYLWEKEINTTHLTIILYPQDYNSKREDKQKRGRTEKEEKKKTKKEGEKTSSVEQLKIK